MGTQKNYATTTIVRGSDGNDSISNYGSYATIDAGAGNDTLVNSRDTAIGLRNDNRLIRYESFAVEGIYSSLNGGDGDDVLINYISDSTLVGGAGNDTLIDYSGNAIFAGGAGNDLITLGAHSTLEYGAGDGNDTVAGANGTNYVRITDGTYSTMQSGDNLLIKIGKETLTMRQAYGLNIKILTADDSLAPDETTPYLKILMGSTVDDTLYFAVDLA